MLIDLHAHTSGISTCCRAPAPEIVAAAKKVGIDGIVLTNHYDRSLFRNGEAESFARAYTEEFRYTKQCGEAIGCTVLYGMEITMARHGNLHMLLYGVDEDFTLAHPTLYDLTLEELYRLAHEQGGIVVQAHPFRGGNRLQDPSVLDGVEINCHPGYLASFYREVSDFAVENGLILTCGGDYHADSYRAFCGVEIPDTIRDGKALAAYLRTADPIQIRMQEPQTPNRYTVTYSRRDAACRQQSI
ncbi:MAG: PHP domain-containing protein [Ruminococcaceae bacterium]|nr:PHP domain-containing protein [Oscillospiraceae bacterium]